MQTTARPTAASFFRAWTASVTFGEFVGFCVPAAVGAVVLGQPDAVVIAALVLAGSVEGAVLGWSQARVLRRPLPRLSSKQWITSTAEAAALAWFVGILPSTTYRVWSAWPPLQVLVTGVALGLVLLCSIGFAQWLELRRHVRHARWWIAATAAAWCVGLAAFVVVTSRLWQAGQPLVLVAAIGALGGLVMATTMALVTGRAIRWLLEQ